MRKRSASVIGWVLFGVGIAGVLALGLWLMPRVRAATTYVPPTSTAAPPTPTPIPPTHTPTLAPPTSTPSETASPTLPPTAAPTSALDTAPDFTLPGVKGTTMTLADQLGDGPVVLAFFQRVGG